jgi:hypothetical protein
MKFVKITHDEYRNLKQSELMLCCIEWSGVDNWPGIDFAQHQYDEQLEELNLSLIQI